MAKHDKHELEAYYVRETERGVCLKINDVDVWLPKSQIVRTEPVGEAEFAEGDFVRVLVPEWLMDEKEIAHD